MRLLSVWYFARKFSFLKRISNSYKAARDNIFEGKWTILQMFPFITKQKEIWNSLTDKCREKDGNFVNRLIHKLPKFFERENLPENILHLSGLSKYWQIAHLWWWSKNLQIFRFTNSVHALTNTHRKKSGNLWKSIEIFFSWKFVAL